MKIENRILYLLAVFLCGFWLGACNQKDVQSTQPPDFATSQYPTPLQTPELTTTSAPTRQLEKPTDTPAPTQTLLPTPIEYSVRFGVIGDYGQGNQAERDVASLLKSWSLDFIITTGDNNYPSGSAETIDHNIGQYYHEFIFPYRGAYGKGAEKNRFFPTLGNHDWDADHAKTYLDYLTLPGNERYYDFIWTPAHFFALSSDSREPDGVSRSSVQAQWLETQLAGSTSAWKIVFMHHPPFTSGQRGPVNWMRWPFRKWGADIVLSGHDHFYERLNVDGFPYIINGLGGGPIYAIGNPVAGSIVRYNDDYGGMLVVADKHQITFKFINRQGEIIDIYQLSK